MTSDALIHRDPISEDNILAMIRAVAQSIRPTDAPEAASLAEIVHDSLQHMRFVVAIEDELGLLLDDFAILDLRFDDEQRLARDLVRLAAEARS